MYTSRAILAVAVAVAVFFVIGDAFRTKTDGSRKKSREVNADLDGSGFVEAGASKATKHAQTLKEMRTLAHRVISGEEKIYNETLQLLSTVEDTMAKAEREIDPQHDEHQAEVDEAFGKFASCTARHATRSNAISEVAALVKTLGGSHHNSRKAEKDALLQKNKTCAAFQAYVDTMSLPKCTLPPGCDWDAGYSCITTDIQFWIDRVRKDYPLLKKPCDDAIERHKNAAEFADAEQTAFEFESCKLDLQVTTSCEDLRLCWEDATETLERVQTRIKAVPEPALKAEYKAVKNIQCYLQVLKAEEKDMPKALAVCENLTVDTSRLNVEYYKAPDPPECNALEPRPCAPLWLQEEYEVKGKAWHVSSAGEGCPATGLPGTVQQREGCVCTHINPIEKS